MFGAWLLLGVWSLDTLATRALAVAGAAAVGAFGASGSLRVAGRFVGAKKTPRPAVLSLRVLGAGAGGLAAWLWLFGPGGPHWGGGGSGNSLFGGGGEEKSAELRPISQTAPQTPPSTERAATADDTATVIMLGGPRVTERHFYELRGENRPMTFDDLVTVLTERQKAGLKTVEILIYRDSVADNHLAVRRLISWAQEHKMVVKLPPAPPGNAP